MATRKPKPKEPTFKVSMKSAVRLSDVIIIVEAKINNRLYEGAFWPKRKAHYELTTEYPDSEKKT